MSIKGFWPFGLYKGQPPPRPQNPPKEGFFKYLENKLPHSDFHKIAMGTFHINLINTQMSRISCLKVKKS